MRGHNPDRINDTTSPLQFQRGEEIVIEMVNISNSAFDTGNRHKYNIEVLTEDGWMDVRGVTTTYGAEYTSEAIRHPPGDGFEWRFELTEGGIVEDNINEEHLEVCPGLPEGRYRFAFFGLIGSGALAVEFDLVD